MSTLTFADTHNMVTFLEKPAKSHGFHEIIDFLNANQIRYALIVNPTICTSCIQQFWATVKSKTVNGERQIQALIDKKKVVITESSIRSDLYLEDAGAPFLVRPSEDSIETILELMLFCVVLICKKLVVLDLEKQRFYAQVRRSAKFKRRGRVESSEDQESLGNHEDASKQGRSIEDVDKDADVSLVDDTHGRSDDAEMFDINDLHGDEVNVDMPVGDNQEQSVKERVP
ncbi:hypothetical protein Tco_0007793 [Tanacetum coccineum]